MGAARRPPALPAQLGAIDREGRPVAGVPVTAKLNLVDWTYSRKPQKRGGYEYQWQRTVKPAGSCTAMGASVAVSCDLVPPENGSYEVITEIDGKPGGVASLWAWGSGGARKAVPTRGRTLEIIPDKGRYVAGETAKLLVQNPYPSATAIGASGGDALIHMRCRAMRTQHLPGESVLQ